MKLLSPNLIHLTSILSDLKYHDGDTIGTSLGITRSAVWKSIKKLEEYGIEIDSVKNKGYALKEPLLLLNQEFIQREVASPNITIEVMEAIDSTSSYLKRADTSKAKICISETQTGGRGRMGRTWHSPFGQNIYMSYARPFKQDASELNGLSLVVSIAILAAIKEIGIHADIMLKWPNDATYLGQKLMGNLVEVQSEAYGESLAIIGLGINVNMLDDKDGTITQGWTSLRKITGNYIDRNLLCLALIRSLHNHLDKFAKDGLSVFLPQWQRLDCLYNKAIEINNGELSGTAKGINDQGNLLLELPGGQLISCPSGETSIRKEQSTSKIK